MSTINRQRATRLTRGAQATLALLVVGAGSAIAVAVRSATRVDQPPETLVLPVIDVLGKKDAVAVSTPSDMGALAERLGTVSNHPVPVDVPVVVPVKGTTPQPVVSMDTKYLGAVGMGDARVALLVDAGKQRFVGVGDSFAGGTVEGITDSEVRIGGARPRTISLAARSADIITRAGAGRVGAPGTVPPLGQPGAAMTHQAGGLTPAYPLATPVAPANAEAAAKEMRSRFNLPDYVNPNDAEDFNALREHLRQSEKVSSEEELNEMTSKLLESNRGDPSYMKKVRIGYSKKEKEGK